MIRKLSLIPLVLGLAACAEPADVNKPVAVQAIDLQGKATRCLPQGDLGIHFDSYEITGDLRMRLLTPEAAAAGIRIYRKGSDVTNYGQQTLLYVNSAANCVLWMEGITLQEYGQRLGLDPIGLSPFYEPVKPTAPVTPAPAPSPVPTPTPAS